jgi:hypothetical protein
MASIGVQALISLVLRALVYALSMLLLLAFRRREEDLPAGFVLSWLGLAVGLLITFALAINNWWGWPVFALNVALLFPWLTARTITIPLGLFRVSYFLGYCARFVWYGSSGGAVVAGAWALNHVRSVKPSQLSWLDSRCEKIAKADTTHIVGAALLSSARGDDKTARMLFENLEHTSPATCPRAARVALDWRVTDAAARGQWYLASLLADTTRPVSRYARFVSACAGRLSGGEHSAPGLVLRWLVAPRRTQTISLLRRALDAPTQDRPAARTRPPSPLVSSDLHADHLGNALRMHASVLARTPTALSMNDLVELGEAWDRALEDPATRDRTLHRAAALGARKGLDALSTLERDARGELSSLIVDSGVQLSELTPREGSIGVAARAVRETLLSDLELAFDALRQRVHSTNFSGQINELREWLSLQARYEEAASVGGPELRRLAFPHTHTCACSHAVWLWNEHDEQIIANSIFAWLLEQARIVDDAEAITLQEKNWDPAL